MFFSLFTRQNVGAQKIGLASEVLRARACPVGLDLAKENRSTYWIKGFLICKYELENGLIHYCISKY